LSFYLKRNLSVCPPGVDLSKLFQGTAAPASTVADDTIDELVARYQGLTAAEAMSSLYLSQNDGIEVPITRNGLRGYAEMALPFLDYRFLDLLLSTRVQDRCNQDIHRSILERFAPALLGIPNSNTGAPVEASPFRLFATDKINTVLKRLRVPGFRHYHYMEAWLKGFLADQVRAIVLDERTLSRGVFSRGYLTEIVERARGDSRMSRLLNFVMNFEIWCRLFRDGDGLQPASEAPANPPHAFASTTIRQSPRI
jgi:asparagine synthase (glutamine-hydrolysing)